MCSTIYFGDKGKLNTLKNVSSNFYIPGFFCLLFLAGRSDLYCCRTQQLKIHVGVSLQLLHSSHHTRKLLTFT